MKFETKSAEEYRDKRVKELTEQAWEHFISASYAQTAVEEIEKAKAGNQKEIDEHAQKVEELAGEHERVKREERKEHEKAVKGLEASNQNLDKMLTQLRQNIQSHVQQANEKLARAKFIRESFPKLLETYGDIEN